jgi:uncharacterized protein YbjT (DUF2867 family)
MDYSPLLHHPLFEYSDATEPRSSVALWHEAGERAIQASGIPWTFVRPGAFMSNALFLERLYPQ